MKKLLILALLVSPMIFTRGAAQVRLDLTLEQAIELAHKQSLYSFRAKNMYLASYWQFRSFKAERLPSLTLNATPISFSKTVQADFTSENFTDINRLLSSGTLNISQNFVPTGGVFEVTSSLQRIDNLSSANPDDKISYASNPISIGFRQSLNGYNEFRWQARTEPLRFEMAKKTYLQTLQTIATQTITNFFNTVDAEIEKQISETNYSNADTLYRIGRGRFEIGTVTQDELLDLELGLLNAEISMAKADIALREAKTSLNSFLGLPEDVVINCIVPANIPPLKIKVDDALSQALENNPQVMDYELSLLNAKERVAQTRANTGLDASIRASLGLNRQDRTFQGVYQPPFADDQVVGVSLSVPIMDWGYRKGQIQMAKSNQEVTEYQIAQNRIDFEQNVINEVLKFNLQEKQVAIASKADTIAQMGFDVTKQRFMIDKVDVIRLNSARTSLDSARRNYYNALRSYWASFYAIRQLTLYDFLNDKTLIEELDELLQEK
ncbi:MAG: TolC family protein [Cytophagaceae bacterium]|jgi:outer membrane protein TolC|nr:TolC family protein [Cytophagaceae bacterium]